mgnify:CR=1 FL=1
MRWPFHYFIKTVCYLAASAAFLLIFLFCISYAIGVATNSVEYVPTMIPSRIANVKLRIVLPPRIKIQSTTTNVVHGNIYLVGHLQLFYSDKL